MKIFKLRKRLNANLVIEFNHATLNCLTVIKHNQYYQLHDFAEFPVTESLEKTLKEIKAKYHLKQCVIALPHSSVMMKILTFSSKLLEHDIINILQMDLKKQFHCLEPLYFDIEPLGEQLGEYTTYRVVAAKESDVIKYTDPLNKVGFTIHTVDVESLVLERMIANFFPYNELLAVIFSKNNSQIQLALENNQILSVNEVSNHINSTEFSLQSIQRFLKVFAEQHSKPIKKLLMLGAYSQEFFTELCKVQNEISFLDETVIFQYLTKEGNVALSNTLSPSLICLGLALR